MKKQSLHIGSYFTGRVQSKSRRLPGFTIVELLIVIVVIGILAAISIVAYNGIQDRASDTAIQSDILGMAKKIQLDAVDRGEFIEGGSTQGDSTLFTGFTFAPAKSAYQTSSGVNLHYCRGLNSSGQQVFRIYATSKSGSTFVYSSEDGVDNIGKSHSIVASGDASACSGLTSSSFSYGYHHTTNTWYSWTNG